MRAGALAAGFLATPIISAISNEIGLDILQIEAGNDLGGGVGAKVTIGQEIAPGLVAQFSRQFGSEPYDEAMVEYYVSQDHPAARRHFPTRRRSMHDRRSGASNAPESTCSSSSVSEDYLPV